MKKIHEIFVGIVRVNGVADYAILRTHTPAGITRREVPADIAAELLQYLSQKPNVLHAVNPDGNYEQEYVSWVYRF